jgi:hypothetical protein
VIRQLRLLVPRRQLAFPGERWPRVLPLVLSPGAPAAPQGAHRHDASQVDYANSGHPSLTTVKAALDHLLFVPMAVALSGGSAVERGLSIASVGLSWTISKPISAQTLAGPGVPAIATADRVAIATGPFTADSTWTLTATSADGSENKAASTTLAFRSRRHWGTAAADTLDDLDLLALLSGELATGRSQSRVFTAADEYLWFAWPQEFGAPSFAVGGLPSTAWVETVRAHTNQYGHTRSYRLYRSQYRQNGAGISVVVS